MQIYSHMPASSTTSKYDNTTYMASNLTFLYLLHMAYIAI